MYVYIYCRPQADLDQSKSNYIYCKFCVNLFYFAGDIYLKFFQKTDWESDGKIVDWLNGAIEDINNHELGWPYMDAVPGTQTFLSCSLCLFRAAR